MKEKSTKAVTDYLESIGVKISHTQALEVIARGKGFRSRHAHKASELDTLDGVNANNAMQAHGMVLSAKVDANEISQDTFVMNDSKEYCFIEVGPIQVQIKREGEGVVVDLYSTSGDSEPFGSTFADFDEAIFSICDTHNVEVDDVAEWVGLHYQINFDTSPLDEKLNWVNRYIETQSEEPTDNVELAPLVNPLISARMDAVKKAMSAIKGSSSKNIMVDNSKYSIWEIYLKLKVLNSSEPDELVPVDVFITFKTDSAEIVSVLALDYNTNEVKLEDCSFD